MDNFSDILIDWYKKNKRDLPWRNTRNPFNIWLSEVILQQTRVAQGMSYYEKFCEEFNTVKDLAEASEDKVLALWKGLGYYSRGRNLRKAAIQIQEEFGGEFPQTFKELKKLKGVGDYSAAAIASFAFGEKVAVVDGNVYRVLSRVFNIKTAIDSTEGKKYFAKLANELICENDPAMFNQAIMEFGALQCSPKSPDCTVCPFHLKCEAEAEGTIGSLPFKAKKTKRRSRYFNFYFAEQGGIVKLEKRVEGDIWANMYQFPLIEVTEFDEDIDTLWETKHVLSHQDLFCRFIKVDFDQIEGEAVELKNIDNYALPRVIENFLERYYN